MNIYMDYIPIRDHFEENEAMSWLDNFYPELEFNVEEDVLEIDGDEDEVIDFANHMAEVTWAYEDRELSFTLIHPSYNKLPF